MNASALFSLVRRIALALALAASATAHATTIVVDDAGDTPTPGKCTLREAITAANANTAAGGCAAGQAGPTVDLIHFAIAGAGLHTITLASQLPDITDIVTVDGYTQAGSSVNTKQVGDDAKLMIEVSGANLCSCVPMLRIAASGTWVRGLVIDHTSSSGIYAQAISGTTSDVVVEGNFIGVDATGMSVAASSNQAPVKIIGNSNRLGGTTAAERNVIGGGGNVIVTVGGTDNIIRGNYIGVSADGAQGLQQNFDGFPTTAIDFSAGGASNGTLVGGSVAGAGNVLFGTFASIHLGSLTQNAVIKGNYIGTDATGTVGFGATYGITTDNHPAGTIIGGALAGEGNLISGNSIGIQLGDGASGTVIQGNRIGTDAGGTKPLPNRGDGIHITTPSNLSIIGGTAPGEGNTIAYNCSNGIAVAASTGWALLGNSIYSNVGLGISLQDSDTLPLANDFGDSDTGANNLQNFPQITAAPITAGFVDIAGTLNSLASTSYRLEFFSGIGCHLAGNGEGRHFLGSLDVITDSNGNASFGSGAASYAVPAAHTVFTATATDPSGNTSEFSGCFGIADLILHADFESCSGFD
jgi:CSLREA domain-containing protein